MSNSLRTLAIAAFALISAAGRLSAQTDVPHVISYQGTLQSNDGKPLQQGKHTIGIHLFTDSIGSEEMWHGSYDLEVTPSTASCAVFNVSLGSGASPFPATVEFNRPLWIGSQVDDGPIMKPLTPLASSPYALTVADQSITANKMATDYIGAISVNGNQISTRGGTMNFTGGPGVTLDYDDASKSIVIENDPSSVGGNGKGAKSTLTVHSGTAGQMAYYASNGTAVDGNANATISNSSLRLGQSGTTTGKLLLSGSSSGTVTISPQSSAGSYNFNLPSSTPGTSSSGQPLLWGGSGPMTFGTLGVAAGGTGSTSFTNHGVLLGSGGNALGVTAVGATHTVLHGNTGANPTFSAIDLEEDVTEILPATNGGTGHTSYTNGQLLIGNTSSHALDKATLTAGSGISIANSPGAITISSAGVTSVNVSGGTTGLTTSGGPITNSGTVALGGTLTATHGGTGQTAFATGDILYASAANTLSKRSIGANGTVLTVSGGVPVWSTLGSVSGVSSAAGTANQILVNGGTSGATGAITMSLPNSVRLGATAGIGGSLSLTDGAGHVSTLNNAVGSVGTYSLPTAANGTLVLTSDMASAVLTETTRAESAEATLTALESANASAITTETTRATAVELTLLPLTGGSMTGVIDMGSNPINNLADPTNQQDAATKQYVDYMTLGGDLTGIPGSAIIMSSTNAGNDILGALNQASTDLNNVLINATLNNVNGSILNASTAANGITIGTSTNQTTLSSSTTSGPTAISFPSVSGTMPVMLTGTVTLSAGTGTVSIAGVTASDQVIATRTAFGGTPDVVIATASSGSVTITSHSSGDTSTFSVIVLKQ